MITTHPPITRRQEPSALRSEVRELFDRAPDAGQRLLDAGDWIARPLWESWGDELRASGWTEERFRDVVADYSNELRLWVIGERPWAHALDGLIGRVQRRSPAIIDSKRLV